MAHVIEFPSFLRLFQMRTSQIMWLFGAGTSRSAGIKTAGDMIWDFKQRLYLSQKKLSPSAITDIGELAVRRKLQSHFDALGSLPSLGDETEYSAYFEATYPSPKDRRTYLEELMARGKPSFGHLALALMMREKLCRVVWTTNFDRMVEDATAQILGSTGRLVIADLKEPEKFRTAYGESRWPIYGKLHGDYHSEALKNTTEELRKQDAEMRRNLINACRGQGLAVVGNSGRDATIIEALTEAMDDGRGFPGGLFWFKRCDDNPYPAVVSLIERARALDIEAHFIETESFDELFSDLVRYLPQTADKIQALAGATRPRLANSSPRASTATTPAIRMNALPIVSQPALCRLVDCEIGGYREIQEAITNAKVDIDAQRIRDGVLSFGRDADIRKVFESFGIKAFDTHPLSSRRFDRETGERALIREALFRSIGKRPRLSLFRKGRRTFLVPDHQIVQSATFNSNLAKPVDRIAGIVPKTQIEWTEACGVRIDFRFDRLWLLLEPMVLADVPDGASEEEIELTREFVRERRARRRNREANALLDGWIVLVVGIQSSVRVRAFGIGDGIDAEFEILRTSGFSGRGRS
ncbi:MAG: SIR2 family protein [Bradyrhizobium sp.]|nr:SIR2 family protein [Bradyrhizobium sp.]